MQLARGRLTTTTTSLSFASRTSRASTDGRIDKQTDGWTHGKLPLVAESGWKNPNANVGVWRFTNIGINLSVLFPVRRRTIIIIIIISISSLQMRAFLCDKGTTD